MNQTFTEDAGFERLVELARQAAAAPVDPDVDRSGRARLVASVTRMGSRWRYLTVWLEPIPKMAWAAVLVFIVGGFAWGLASRPIGFVVRGLDRPESYVRAANDRPVDVDFSDGTRIHADAGARLRVEERSSRGARILLERGRAMVQVAHRAGARWCFVAGPFEVEVRGTKFVLGWDPVAEQLELRLEEGLVEVSGPLGPRQVAVRAGQQLLASLPSRSLTLSELSTVPVGSSLAGPAELAVATAANASAPALAAEPRADVDMASPPQPSVALQPQATASASAQASPSQGHISWSKLLAKGQFEAIVRLAESPDHPNCAEHCSATDLRALAEAARYVGRTDLAESTLLALRRRFPEHVESKKAAFLLGRLYEARADRGRAESWYQTYLRESPSSELAADALAGQMRVVRRARGVKAAEPLAREYLRRYPDGVHASAAQQILREP